jgi:predicted metal-binding protein
MARQVSEGAVDAAVIAADKIEIEDNLAKVCIDPGCHNYGASPGCPPHVEGPAAFRRWLKSYKQALFIKIDVPMDSLLSYEYRDIMRLLHEMVVKIETAAIAGGHTNSRGFAGGSCKELFCFKYTDCNVLERNSECRNPGLSRPSMSGFGVNVSRLKDLAGWNNSTGEGKNKSEALKMGAVYGLILIG